MKKTTRRKRRKRIIVIRLEASSNKSKLFKIINKETVKKQQYI